jgi:hypothetical protein
MLIETGRNGVAEGSRRGSASGRLSACGKIPATRARKAAYLAGALGRRKAVRSGGTCRAVISTSHQKESVSLTRIIVRAAT